MTNEEEKMQENKAIIDLTLEEALMCLSRTLYDRNVDMRVIMARQELIDVIRNETNKLKKDLEVLEILKPFLKRDLHIEKIDLTKEENKIYKGYLPKDYNKTYIYKWDYNYSVWDVFRNEENAILLKRWLDGKD